MTQNPSCNEHILIYFYSIQHSSYSLIWNKQTRSMTNFHNSSPVWEWKSKKRGNCTWINEDTRGVKIHLKVLFELQGMTDHLANRIQTEAVEKLCLAFFNFCLQLSSSLLHVSTKAGFTADCFPPCKQMIILFSA